VNDLTGFDRNEHEIVLTAAGRALPLFGKDGDDRERHLANAQRAADRSSPAVRSDIKP
jgi:hypothetical protein